MKAIIQRVHNAKVDIENKTVGSIQNGILVLLGISKEDKDINIEKTIKKIINLRIFNDENGKMNLSVLDTKGEILVVSNFTIYGDTKKGNRPSYINAQSPELAEQIYNDFVKKLKLQYPYKISTGKFQADMQISLVNDGPVTLIVEN